MGHEVHIEGAINIYPPIRRKDLFNGDGGGFNFIKLRTTGKWVDGLIGPNDEFKLAGGDQVSLARFIGHHTRRAARPARFSGAMDFRGLITDWSRFTAAGRRLIRTWWCPEHKMWPDPHLFGEVIDFKHDAPFYNWVNQAERPEGCSCHEVAALPPF